MDGKKVYQIQINGISESINAVEALNKQLLALENRIKELEKSGSVNVKAKGTSNASALSDEERIQKEINKLKQEGATLDAKIVAAQDEVYKRVDATKQLYKETIADQKAMAAQERLTADAYSNTMQGMKQHLADLKAVINATDLGDSNNIKQMTQEANELTNKLKDMEQAYGQFGRNVGNYANGVAEGLQKVKIAVGDDVREFDNAKQAAKALGNELKTMAVNGQQGTKEFKDLQKAVAQLNSDIKDATVSSKAMDNLLDTMQSFAAIGSVTQGMSALFGFDDAEIQKSIQKLVALQNVMQGIEKINQQMNSKEGIGGWISKGNAAIDTLVAKLTGANTAQQALNASTVAGKTASEGLAVAETAQATATAGATVATKALSLALKALGIGLVIAAVAYLIEYWEDIYKWFTDTIPVLKNLNTWFDKIKAVVMGVGSVIINWLVQPLATVAKVIQDIINGDFKKIPSDIADGIKKQYNIIGNFQKGYHQETERQQKAHNEKMIEQQKEANEELLKDEEAKYGKSHKRTQEYLKKQMALTKKGSKEYKELQRQLWEDERREKEENDRKKLSAAKKSGKQEVDVEKEINQLRISMMKEGLNKTITQLEEERKQRLAKLKDNSRYYQEVNALFDAKILEEKEKWAKDMEKIYSDMWKVINADNLANSKKAYELTVETQRINKQDYETNNDKNYFTSGRGGWNYGDKGKDESAVFAQRLKIVKDYWESRSEVENEDAKDLYNKQLELLKNAKKNEEDEIVEHYNAEIKIASDYYTKVLDGIDAQEKKGLIKQEEANLERRENESRYNKAMTQMFQNYSEQMRLLEEKYNSDTIEAEQKLRAEVQSINAEKYQDLLQEFRDFQTQLNNIEQKQPIVNAWGITNFEATNSNNKKILTGYQNLSANIIKVREQTQKDFDSGLIDKKVFDSTIRELNNFEANLSEKMAKVKYDLSITAQIGQFFNDINQYVQVVGQSIQTVMSSLADYQQYQFDKEQEELDKQNDLLEEKLDEQQRIIEEHKSAIDSIEDELATARGDRRQHLIDQINAEIEAQRAAQREEDAIQKQKERAEKKQADLDYRRQVAQWENNKLSILVSTAMATANGLATQPFWPVGVAMGALATALGMVQYALAEKQKPQKKYASGGLLQGKSHAQGGIKAGGVELEGNEYVINKRTTSHNLDLLEYINSKKNRVGISDLIDFYSSGKVKKNIVGIKTKFADGGYLPTLRNDININDRLITAMEDYSNRPVVVSVVDINSRQEAVKNVQVLAGLGE